MRRIIQFCVIASTSVAPGWAQEVNVSIPKGAKVQYGGMLKPFSYNKPNAEHIAQSKTAKAIPKHSPSKSHLAYHYAPATHEGPLPESARLELQTPKSIYQPAATSITLSSGIVKIPAETASGYCLKAPPSYIGTGSANRPAVTAGLPRCEKVASNLGG